MSDEDQRSFFEVDYKFVKVHHDMVTTGKMAALGAMPFTLLVALRSYVPTTGTSAFPSQQTLAEATGMSLSSVKKGLNILHEQGWLVKRAVQTGKRKKNIYALKEVLTGKSTDPDARPDHLIVMDYGPTVFQEQRKDVDRWRRTGQLPPGSPVIVRPVIVIQVNNGDHGTNININADGPTDEASFETQLAQIDDEELRDRLASTVASFRALQSPKNAGE